MSASQREGIVLISDDPDLSRGVQEAFRAGGLVLACERHTERGIGHVMDAPPRLVIVDASRLGTRAVQAVRHLRSSSAVPLIVISPSRNELDPVVVLESGADDCICRPARPAEVLARARAVLRRAGRGGDRAGPTVEGISISPASRSARVDGRPVNLTAAEYDLLEFLARAAGHVVSREELVEAAFRRAPSPLDRSLDVHVSRLRRKLQPRDRQIVTVRGVGYMLARD